MGDLIRLVHDEEPPKKAFAPCETCAFYHPKVDLFGTQSGGWFKPRVPSALAHQYAVCTAQGGDYASTERRICKGDWHSPK